MRLRRVLRRYRVAMLVAAAFMAGFYCGRMQWQWSAVAVPVQWSLHVWFWVWILHRETKREKDEFEKMMRRTYQEILERREE